MPFYGGAADRFALGHTAATDSIPMIFEDFETKGFGGMLARQDSRETMPESPAAIVPHPMLARQQDPHAGPRPTGMPRPPFQYALVSQTLTSAVRTRLWRRVLRNYMDF